jgi:hypothetical protein
LCQLKLNTKLLSKLPFLEKIKDFRGNLANFESICKHTVEKFDDKDPKKTRFSNQIKPTT